MNELNHSAQHPENYACLEGRELVVNLLQLHAEAKCADLEQVVGEVLESALVPQNRDARCYTRMLMDNPCIATGYQRVYSYLAGGLGVEAKALGGRPLVEAFSNVLHESNAEGTISGPKGDIAYLTSKLDSIVEYITENTDGAPEYLVFLTQQMKESPTRQVLVDLVDEILTFWALLENKSVTYRALHAMAGLTKDWIRNEASDRCALVDAIRVVSAQWE